jgi:hypothetical protein
VLVWDGRGDDLDELRLRLRAERHPEDTVVERVHYLVAPRDGLSERSLAHAADASHRRRHG